MRDQAERLRQMVERLRAAHPPGPADGTHRPTGHASDEIPAASTRRTRVIAVTSGKGGAGKTNVSVNLAYALQRLGREVVLLDADLGLANVDVLLGTTPRYHLGHLLRGERSIVELVYTAPEGLRLIAGGSGLAELVDVGPEDLARFIRSLRQLQGLTDYLLVDTAAGLGRAVQAFTLAADEVLLVTTPEPTALTDAYALIKTLLRQHPAARISLVVNQAQSHEEAEQAAERLGTTALRFLGVALEVLGFIPLDQQVTRAVRRQNPFVLAYPHSPASQAIMGLARRLAGETPAPSLFFDRLARLVTRWREAP